MTTLVLGLSIILQSSAALLSLRLLQKAMSPKIWIFISFTLTMMALGQVATFYQYTINHLNSSPGFIVELIALSISILTLGGVILIAPFFIRMGRAAANLRTKQFSIDNSAEAIFWIRPDAGFLDVNQTACWMTGYTRSELLDLSLWVLDPDVTKDAWEAFKSRSDSTESITYETYIRKKDGQRLAVEVSASMYKEGNIENYCAFVSDITARKLSESRVKRFSSIFENSVQEIYLFDQDTLKCVQANVAAQQNLGYSIEEFNQLTLLDLSPDATPESFNELIKPLLDGRREKVILVSDLKRKDDSQYPVEVHLQLLEYEGEKLLSAMIIDLTERHQYEEEHRKLSQAVEASSSMVIVTNLEGDIEYVNPTFSEITGYPKSEVIGQNVRLLKSEETPAAIHKDIWKTIIAGKVWKGTIQNKKDGSLYWDRAAISGVKDSSGEITHFVSIQEDVSHEHMLSFEANHDSLTGLINRREFERRIDRVLSTIQKDQSEHAICYLDLDQFKVVNDTCGHAAGDELLRQLSEALQRIVRKRDTLARLGGDEFGVLMEHCSIEDAHRVTSSLQKVIQDHQFTWAGHNFKVGASMGLIPITQDAGTMSDLLREADAACYKAKELGRNRIHIAHVQESETNKQRSGNQWAHRLNEALTQGRFRLMAQPMRHPNGSEQYELLVRMINEQGENVPPGSFLPAAERYNLVGPLDQWVIETTLSLLSDNPNFLEKIQFVSINLSSQTLNNEEFLDFMRNQLELNGIPGNKICFEIAELTAISSLSTASNFITSMTSLGCQFALDNAGLNSFSYLANLPVDYLKIDGTLIKNIVSDPMSYAMVKSICDVGHVMGLQVIAKSVENDTVREKVTEIGIDYCQGYGIGKPLDFDEILTPTNAAGKHIGKVVSIM